MFDDLNLILKMKFGSHLYGTSTENSDTDFKGIFLPTKEQIYLGKIPKAFSYHSNKNNDKNCKEDVDTEIYSLHYFIHLACEGETVALDMLHVPDNMIIQKSHIWDNIVSHRQKFFTKNLKAFVGYARKQASKYGVKGSRLNNAKLVLDFCQSNINDEGIKLSNVWDKLPTGEHIFKHDPDVNGIRMYEVCGRKVGETATLKYMKDVINHFYIAYGVRARQAANNENVDWKAISHAFRAAFQTKQILTEGTIKFPLKEADFLLNVKLGKYHYQNEISKQLDDLITEVEELSSNSNLPEKVDRKFWDNWLINIIDEELKNESRR